MTDEAENPRAGLEMRVRSFYLMRDEPQAIVAAAAEHATYWQRLGLSHYLGGPFADRSGGLINFDVSSCSEAERLIVRIRSLGDS